MVEAKPEQRERKTLEDLVLANRKRTFKMFANDQDAPIPEDPSLIKMKIKSKVTDQYSKLGEIPGVLVDKIGRQKILKDLGTAAATETKHESLANIDDDEESKAEVSMVTQKAIHDVEESNQVAALPGQNTESL